MGNDLVREARRRAGLTQQELAERAGTTQSAIARLESGGTTPSFDLVLRLVRHCGLDIDVQIVPYDDSDWTQAERLRSLTAAQRWSRAETIAGQMRSLRGSEQRGA